MSAKGRTLSRGGQWTTVRQKEIQIYIQYPLHSILLYTPYQYILR